MPRDALTRRVAQASAIALGCLVLAGCAGSTSKLTSRIDPRYGVAASPRVVEPGQPVPKGGGVYRVGKPYEVAGRVYMPEENGRYRAEGPASWYGDDFHGRLTANGEIYDMGAISAAHPTLPMPSYVRVTNLRNQKSLIVRVNDRGPYHANREIDVSARAADLLGFRGHGTTRVRVEYVGAAPLEGTDDRMLMATLRDGAPAPPPAGVMVASNRFLPNFPRAPIRGGTPVPQDRPYDLGEGSERVAAASPQARAAYEPTPDSELFAERPSPILRSRPVAQAGPEYEAPRQDARRLAAEALARQPARAQWVETSPDTPQTAYLPRSRVVEARNVPVPERQRPAAPSSVTAYAPMYFDGGAVSTGRGLY